jgi:hypothetical protein
VTRTYKNLVIERTDPPSATNPPTPHDIIGVLAIVFGSIGLLIVTVQLGRRIVLFEFRILRPVGCERRSSCISSLSVTLCPG